MEKKSLKVKIIPIVKKKWIPKFIARNKLITSSLLRTKIAFKVTPEGESVPDKLILEDVCLAPEKLKGFVSIYENIEIGKLKSKKSTKTKAVCMVFPYQGLFWLEVTVRSEPEFSIETLQKSLEGGIGRGWADRFKRNFCRMPIGVVDILAVRLTILTIWLVIFTALLLFVNFFPDILRSIRNMF